MGGALLSQWIKNDSFDFTVVDPVAENLPDNIALARNVGDLGETRFDIVVVAVKPQMIDDVMPPYAAKLTSDGCVASIAAGCSIARLKTVCSTNAVVRIMPNLPSAIGAGVSGLCASEKTTDSHRKAVETLMAAAGTFVWVDDEDQLDRVTAVSGSGPGYVFEIARVYVEAAESLGFSTDQARELVLGTMAGTIAMAQAESASLEELRTSVTSKNGTTQAGLEALNGDNALSERMRAVVEAAYQRAIELR